MEYTSDSLAPEFKYLIRKLASEPNIIFISQQRGDADLSLPQKISYAEELLQTDPNKFLTQFGLHLSTHQLQLFKKFNSSEEGIVICNTVERLLQEKDMLQSMRMIKNRRFQAMQDLIENSSYFTDLEMMKRAPLLYDQLIGQYLTPEERQECNDIAPQDTLVKILMEGIELNEAKELQKQQKLNEESTMEEEDTSEDETDAPPNVSRNDKQNENCQSSNSHWGECEDLTDDRLKRDEFYSHNIGTVIISEKQKLLLRKEFQSIMFKNFLDGKDNFDYTQVDNNDTYDNLKILSQDAEDSYFDGEDSNEMETDGNIYSEDELEIFMNRLHKHHPEVKQVQ